MFRSSKALRFISFVFLMTAIMHSQVSKAISHDGGCRVRKQHNHSKISYVPDNTTGTPTLSAESHQGTSEGSYVTPSYDTHHDLYPNKTTQQIKKIPHDDSQPEKNLTLPLPSQPAPAQAQAHNQIELSPVYKGTGTTWGGNWKGGNCGFKDWDPPAGIPEVAMAGNLWNSASLCGSCVEVTGPIGLKKVAIVGDSCFSCSKDGLDMDPVMWNAVTGNASPSALPITWKIIPCGFPTPLKIINKEGVSRYFMSMQIAGANQPVHSVEISTDGGQSWTNTTRQSSDNFFQLSNPPKDSATIAVKVTCASGKNVIANKVDYSRPGIAATADNC
ncbi:RlpA-like double-psi beta-barrel-protein domain-containing protein-containing protein [Melampsora americana]|nr:RlpA-like double-psi beta-barrel-protein domain-containing protein-containing protein [Melampsora americana]